MPCTVGYPKLTSRRFQRWTILALRSFFDPKRSAGRVSGIMPNSANRTPRDSRFIQREIQEIRNALEAFKAAFEKGRAVELLLIP
jgi:hypothetical protein